MKGGFVGRLLWIMPLLSGLVLPSVADAWGRGHKLIRTWAVDHLPEWQCKAIGPKHIKALCNNYSSLQDAFAGGKSPHLAPYCTIPNVRVSLHDVNAVSPSVQGMQWYLHCIRREWQAGRHDEAMKFLGVLCHWHEDPGCPSAHSSPVSEPVLRQLIPPPPDKQNLNYLFGYGGIADVGDYSIPEQKYQPKLLGATIPEAAARLYQQQRILQRHATAHIIPLVQDMMYGDGKKAKQERSKAALRNAKHTADVIYTTMCLATGKVDETEAANLKTQSLTDWLPDPTPQRLIPHPYYVVPYLVDRSMDAKRKLHPLAFPESGPDAAVSGGFGTGTPFSLNYSIAPGGVFDTFTCRVGLHPTAGPKGKVRFVVSANGKPLFTSPTILSGSKPVKVRVTLPKTSVVKLTLSTVAVEMSVPSHNLAVWAEPMLHRAETVTAYQPPKQ